MMRATLVVLAVVGTVAPGWCELDWVLNADNAHSYARWDQTGTWWDAHDAIEAYNATAGTHAHLATFCEAVEENWVKAQFGASEYFWIGFTDCDHYSVEGEWVWVTGEPVTYTNWYGNEPNNQGDEDYAAMNWHGGWNDAKGTAVLGAIFEIDAAPGAMVDESPERGAWFLLVCAAGLGGALRARARQRASYAPMSG